MQVKEVMHYTEVVVLETPYSVPNPGERGLNPSYEILRDYKSGGLINIKTGKTNGQNAS